MKRLIHAVSVLAALMLPAVSCTENKDIQDGPDSGGRDALLLLHLRAPGNFAASRAMSFAEENVINAIHVLVFDNTNTLVDIKQGEDVTSTPGHADPDYSGSGSFSVTLAASKTTADTYNLVVLANAQAVVAALGAVQDIADKSYSSVTAALQAQITGAMYPAGGEIPMWGETGQVVVEPGSANRTMSLTRAVARIDVGVGAAGYDGGTHAWSWNGRDAANAQIPFSLAHVYVVRPNGRYAVVPERTKAAGEPTVPAGTAAFSVADSKSKFAFAAANGCVTQRIYVPEANVRMGVSGTPGDANHANRMAVVVGGYYNGSATETFYRLDFAQGGSLINVLRNRLYRFSISKVAGAGYADVETAFNSLAMNMTAEVLDWDVTDMGGVVVDGQYALSVSRTAVELSEGAYTAAGTENKLNIRTDYPGGWTVESITDNATGAAAAWLSLAAADRTGTDKTVSLLLNANTGAVRTARIRVTAGRMAAEVTVTQGYAAALTLSGSTLPGNGIIPNTGGTYVINVDTNLQGWGVKVYQGTSTTPIITKAANPSPDLNRNAAPVASSTTVTIPNNLLVTTTPAKGLVFVLYANEGAEVRVGSFTQKGYDRVGDNRRLTWDGARYVLTTDPTDAGLVFKFGSVVGVFSAHHANQVLPGINADPFDTGDIAWNPTAITAWASLPMYLSTDYPKHVTPEDGYHTVANVKAGRGDPCRLAGLDLNRIKNTAAGSLTYADVDNGVWRLPTGVEFQAFCGYNISTSTAAHWTTLSPSGVVGGMFPTAADGSVDTFLPAAGYRMSGDGAGANALLGVCWPSNPVSASIAGEFQFGATSIQPMGDYTTPGAYAQSIRCVRQ